MYLITGATGNIGGELHRIFSKRGVPARALVRREPQEKHAGIEYVHGDFNDQSSLATALKGIKRAFLVTPFNLDRVEQEKQFVVAAEQAGVEVIVKISSSSPDKRSKTLSLIHQGQGEIEEFIQEGGRNHVFLRPNFFMQNFRGLFPHFKASGVVALPVGDLRCGLIDTRDIAEVAAACLFDSKWWNRAYLLTGHPITFREAASELGRVSNLSLAYHPLTLDEFRDELLKGGLESGTVEVFMSEWSAASLGALSFFTDCVSIITGRQPRSFREYADDHRSLFL